MNRRYCESRIALAMLPVGALITLAAAIGAIAAVSYGLHAAWDGRGDTGWRIAWSVSATLIAVFNLRKGIETMATFDWHVAIAPLVTSAAIVAACPVWWR